MNALSKQLAAGGYATRLIQGPSGLELIIYDDKTSVGVAYFNQSTKQWNIDWDGF